MFWGMFAVLLAIAFFLAGVGLFFDAVRRYRRNRFIRDLPTSTVRSAAMGLAELKGRVLPVHETFTFPFTGREFLLWLYAVRRPPAKRSRNTPPVPLDFGCVGVPFRLEDETGSMLVRPEGAEIRLPRSVTEMDERLKSRRDPDEREGREEGVVYRETDASASEVRAFDDVRRDLVCRHGLPDEMERFGGFHRSDRHEELPDAGRVRYAEARLEPGDEVYVLGNVQARKEVEGEGSRTFVGRVEGADDRDVGIRGWVEENLSLPEMPDRQADHDSVFVISDAGQDELFDVVTKGVWKQAVGGFVILIAAMAEVGMAVASFTGNREPPMRNASLHHLEESDGIARSGDGAGPGPRGPRPDHRDPRRPVQQLRPGARERRQVVGQHRGDAVAAA